MVLSEREPERSVLQVLPHPGGGGETYVDTLSAISTYRFERAYLARSARPADALLDLPLSAFRVQRAARAHSVLHVHGEMAGAICLPSLAMRPSVVTLQGLHLLRRLSGAPRSAAKLSLRLIVRSASRTICSSRAEYSDVFEVVGPRAARRVLVIHNGIEALPPLRPEERARARVELGISPATTVGIAVASLDEHKDPFTPVRAALGIARAGGALVLLLVGDGPLRGELERASGDDAGRAVRVLGYRRDVRPFLAAADFFVLASRREGLSFSLLEAMSLGLPAVVSDGPGNPEAVGDAGIVVPYGDVAGFAAAFARILNDERERRSLSDRARERFARCFRADEMVRRTREVYDEVVRERART